MIEVKEAKDFIKNSSLKKFRAKCSDGTDRVILLKQKEKIYSAKTLLSEYLIGKLAHEFGINTPDVSLIKMNNNLYNSLGDKTKLFDLTCNIGVASDYIELDLPNPNEFYDFLKNNKIYSNQIYGMKLFMCWIYLGDYHKGDVLQFDQQGKLYFLDFNMAFENRSKSYYNGSYDDIWSQLENYNQYKIKSILNSLAKFWNQFPNDDSCFEKWFTKLMELDLDNFILTNTNIPKCWDVPPNYIQDILSFIFTNRDRFIKEFIAAIN